MSQPTIITITISPVANGKRKIVLSGAPKGEMPIVRTGVFADVHRLIDETWVELMKREPQIVTVKAEKKSAPKADGEPDDQSVADETTDEQDQAPDPAEKAIDDATPPIAESEDTIEETESELPKIEGDTDE